MIVVMRGEMDGYILSALWEIMERNLIGADWSKGERQVWVLIGQLR